MTTEFFSVLKQIYGSSGLPCAIADSGLNILWRNRSAETGQCPLKADSLSGLFEGGEPVCGTVSFTDGDTVHRFNILKAEDPADGTCAYVAEHLGRDTLKDLLTSPQIRSYMTYLCARIRESMGMIALSADEIDAAAAVFGAGCGEVTEQLNTINKAIMLIFREVIDPEQLYYVLDPGCDDTTICISDEIPHLAADAARSLGSSAKVNCDAESAVFTRMNRGVFETIVSDMAESCCGGACPKELNFSCKKIGAERAAVTVRSVNRIGKKKSLRKPQELEKKGGALYFDYLCEVMCEKYGAVFTRRELDDGIEFSMEFPMINSFAVGLSSPMLLRGSERFCPMSLSLANYHVEERYKFINVDE